MAYHTEQKEALTEFLRENAAKQYTVRELWLALSGTTDIGESTVFRLIKVLVEEGRVRRFTPGTGRNVYYQYVGGETCDSHLHLKCLICGRLYHLDKCVSVFMQKQIQASNRFLLDENKTMLFGTCIKCQGEM